MCLPYFLKPAIRSGWYYMPNLERQVIIYDELTAKGFNCCYTQYAAYPESRFSKKKML